MAQPDPAQRERQSSLAAALNRYGHHDHDCPEHDLFLNDRDCACGFNRALAASFRDDEVVRIRPTIYRQRPEPKTP